MKSTLQNRVSSPQVLHVIVQETDVQIVQIATHATLYRVCMSRVPSPSDDMIGRHLLTVTDT